MANPLEIFQPDVDVLEKPLEQTEHKLIVHNDDVNTFDWVIESLVDICNHSMIQAEQCTLIVHYKGQCAVKNGEMDKLKPMKNGLLDRGIQATIE